MYLMVFEVLRPLWLLDVTLRVGTSTSISGPGRKSPEGLPQEMCKLLGYATAYEMVRWVG